MKDSNARFLIKVFFVENAGSKTRFRRGYYIRVILFFLLLGMLINTVSDDCFRYVGLILRPS